MSVALVFVGLVSLPLLLSGVGVLIERSCEYALGLVEIDERLEEPLPEDRPIDPLPVRVPGAIYPGIPAVVVDALIVDDSCPVPCTAKHCIQHAEITGSSAQAFRWARQRALETPTGEWDVAALGWKVPNSPRELMAA